MTEPQTFARALPKGEARRPKISVVVPMLNEERGLGPLIDRLRPVLDGLGHDWEVICVDDGSTDNTLAVLKGLNDQDPRIKSISLSRNFGKEIATAAGLSFTTGDAAIIMDADLQHPPELIADFVRRWREGYDVVFGQRIDRHADTLMHRWSARAFYIAFQKLSGTSLPEGAGDFRLLDRKAVDAMNGMRERVRFNKGLFAWMGFRSVGVPFHVEPRAGGASRWRPRALLRFALDGIASFTTIPLRVWSYLGLVISFLALCYAMFILVKTLIFGADVPGFPTLIISVMFFAGVQLISLGVIGEYLGRMYEEVKGRPLFLVAETLGIDKETATKASQSAYPGRRYEP
jgi:glycosyltransferase involved in cell wall biosynthesis